MKKRKTGMHTGQKEQRFCKGKKGTGSYVRYRKALFRTSLAVLLSCLLIFEISIDGKNLWLYAYGGEGSKSAVQEETDLYTEVSQDSEEAGSEEGQKQAQDEESAADERTEESEGEDGEEGSAINVQGGQEGSAASTQDDQEESAANAQQEQAESEGDQKNEEKSSEQEVEKTEEEEGREEEEEKTDPDQGNISEEEQEEICAEEETAQILTVTVPEGISIEYYHEILDDEEELSAYIASWITQENASEVFSGFVDADEEKQEELLEAILEDYMPFFRVVSLTEEGQLEVSRSSAVGDDYVILAEEPQGEKPDILQDYAFSFTEENEEVGSFSITQNQAELERNTDYEISGNHLFIEDAQEEGDGKGTIWILSGSEISVTPLQMQMYDQADPSSVIVEEKEEGIQEFTFVLSKESADAVSVQTTEEYEVDGKAPDVMVFVKEGKEENSFMNQLLSTLTFGIFTGQAASFCIQAEDAGSGLSEVFYFMADAQTLAEELSTCCSDEEKASYLSTLSWKSCTEGKWISLSSQEDTSFVLCAKVVDQVGNVIYATSDGVVVDATEPEEVEVSFQDEDVVYLDGEAVFQDDIELMVLVEDSLISSGIASIEASVSVNGMHIEGAICNAQGETSDLLYSGQKGNRSFKELEEEASIATTFTVLAESCNLYQDASLANAVTVTVTCTDRAGNQNANSISFLVDQNEPEIEISSDVEASGAESGIFYFNEERSITVCVTEALFDEEGVQAIIQDPAGVEVSAWTHSEDETVHTRTYTFSGEGEYNFLIQAVDAAGNGSNTVETEDFILDQTTPLISVTFDFNEKEGHIYQKSRTAQITITEQNFEALDVEITLSASLNGTAIAAPSISGWSSQGKVHTATVSFSEEGDFSFEISYTDLAGNAAYDTVSDFTIDWTDPKIQIEGIENHSANQGVVAPVISIEDLHLDVDEIFVSLEGAVSGKVSVDQMSSTFVVGDKQMIVFENFEDDRDDFYTLTVSATDQAGNLSTESIAFSVNRNGSAYLLNDYTRELVEKGITNDPQDLVITEVNVDTLTFQEITCSRDGTIDVLEEEVDYTVEEEGGEGQWKQYTYTIRADCFTEEGQYCITIYSEDEAKNTSANRIKEAAIEFIVDRTAPSLSVANLTDGETYEENRHTFTISVKDQTAVSSVSVYQNGELCSDFGESELEETEGVVTVTLRKAEVAQDIQILVCDLAGNTRKSEIYHVYVKGSSTENAKNRGFLGLAIISGGFFVSLFFLKRRSKKRGV